MNKKKLLLYGFGTVGKGFLSQFLENPLSNIDCIGIIVKNPNKHEYKPLPMFAYGSKHEKSLFHLADIIIECTNDYEGGIQIIQSALEQNKVVISASKKILAEKLELWNSLQTHQKGNLLFEASAAASIPIFRILNHHFKNEKILSIQAILNGTSNFILSKMENENLDYQSALFQAQSLGYAEIDPYLDVSGWDSAYKLILLTYLSYGLILNKNQVLVHGILHIRFRDIYLAKACGLKIKLLATSQLKNNIIETEVVPHFVENESYFYHVQEANNGIAIEYEKAGLQFYYGKGAGANATGSAMFNDLNFYLDFQKGYEPPIHAQTSSSSIQQSNHYYLSIHQNFEVFLNSFQNSLKIIHQDLVHQTLIVKTDFNHLLKIQSEFSSPLQIIKIEKEKFLHKILQCKQYSNLLL